MPSGRRFSIEAIFKGIDKISRPINKMQNAVGKFSRKMQRGMRKANRAATKVARTLGKGLKMGFAAATTGAIALGVAISKVVTVGAGFEKTMVSAAVKFAGKIRPGSKAFEELEDAARNVGSTTEFTASQSAEALDFLAMAGFGAEQAIGALPGVVDLATVSKLDLARATDIASDTLGAFGLATDDTAQLSLNLARVNDVLAKTSTSANTSVEQMFEAFTNAAPVATDLGISIETVSAMTGKLADAGIKGSKAGIVLKNMMLGVAAATPKAARAFKDLKIKIAETEDGSLDIIKTVGNLNEAFGKLTKLERASKIKDIFGKIPIAGVSVLLGQGAEKLKDFDKELQNATGTSKEMAGVMRDTTQGSLDSLTSAVEGSVISIFKLRDKGIRGVVDRMTEWTRANEDLIASKIGDFLTTIADNIDLIINTAKGLGIAIGIIYGVIAAIKIFNAIMAIANVVMAANPIVFIIAAIVIALGLLFLYWDEVVAGIKYGILSIGQFFTSLWLDILGLANKIIGVASDVKEFFGGDPVEFRVDTSGAEDAFASLQKSKDAVDFRNQDEKDLQASLDKGTGRTAANIGKFGGGGPPSSGEFAMQSIAPKLDDVLNKASSTNDTLKGVDWALLERSNRMEDLSSEPRTVGPQERLARIQEEKLYSSTAQVTIKDETGRAEVTEGKLGQSIKLQPTGTF